MFSGVEENACTVEYIGDANMDGSPYTNEETKHVMNDCIKANHKNIQDARATWKTTNWWPLLSAVKFFSTWLALFLAAQ